MGVHLFYFFGHGQRAIATKGELNYSTPKRNDGRFLHGKMGRHAISVRLCACCKGYGNVYSMSSVSKEDIKIKTEGKEATISSNTAE